MIVIKNDKNNDQYAALWAEAYQALNDYDASLIREDCRHEDESFHSMEEYFAHIGYLKERNLKFLMLPLDEPAFAINANTRAIAPQKIVILQNDHMAEMVMFTIDRYFDYKDLNDAIIYVQWTLPNGETGAAPIEVKDVTSEPGKIRFGWPLDTSITSIPGTVKYSIRFWNRDPDAENSNEEVVVYSLNTLSSTLTITESLQPKINDLNTVTNPNQFFAKAVRNSQYSGDGTPLPMTPAFYAPGTDLNATAHLDKETDTLTLKAEAMTSDSGTLAYSWHFVPAENNSGANIEAGKTYLLDGELAETLNGEVNHKDYRPVDDSVYKLSVLPANVRYYVDKEGNGSQYIAYASTKPPKYNAEDRKTWLFRRYTTYTINPATNDELHQVVGQYFVKANNTLGKNTSSEGSSSACTIPGPSEIAFKTDLVAKAILTKAEDAGEEAVASADLAIELAIDPNGEPAITYQWMKNTEDKNKAEAWENIEDTDAAYTATAPGWYKVKVTSELNRADVEKDSAECTVTFMPAAPTVTYGTIEGDLDASEDAVSINSPVNTEIVLSVNAVVANPVGYESYANELFSDKLVYSWYRSKPDGKNEVLNASNALVVNGAGTNQLTVKPTKAGTYYIYCGVVNTLNGENSESVDKLFTVNAF